MRIGKTTTLLGLLAMTVVLIYGFSAGDFGGEGGQLLSMPWGIVSLVDLYVGFVLSSAWIVYRDGLGIRSVVWVILMMILGFWTASLYTLIALQTRGETGAVSGWGSGRIVPSC